MVEGGGNSFRGTKVPTKGDGPVHARARSSRSSPPGARADGRCAELRGGGWAESGRVDSAEASSYSLESVALVAVVAAVSKKGTGPPAMVVTAAACACLR